MRLKRRGLAEITRAFRAQAAEVKRGRDPSFASCFRIVSLLPWPLVRGFLNLGSWLVYSLNLDLGFLGLPKDPFGSVMVTNVGGMGIDVAWAPLVPYSRVPLILAVGTVRDKAVVENGEVRVRPVLAIGVTFDHRLIDGVHAAQMSHEFKKCFADPARYFGDAAATGSSSPPSELSSRRQAGPGWGTLILDSAVKQRRREDAKIGDKGTACISPKPEHPHL